MNTLYVKRNREGKEKTVWIGYTQELILYSVDAKLHAKLRDIYKDC